MMIYHRVQALVLHRREDRIERSNLLMNFYYFSLLRILMIWIEKGIY